MSSEWTQTTVGDISTLVTKGTTPTTLGHPFQARGVNFIKVEALTEDGRFLREKFMFISEAANQALGRSQLCKNDILFTIAGTIGRTALVTGEILPANTNQAIAIVRPNPSVVRPRFLRYVFSNPSFTRNAQSRTVQSVQSNFSLGELKQAKIALPDIAEQDQIVKILGTIDDRITLLRETNITLETIALTLFRSWFVDFDPVRAKMDGRVPDGMDEATAALFPDEFESKETGALPKGWHVCPLYDLATYINGAAYKAFEPNDARRGLPIIKIAELKAGVTNQTAYSDVSMPEKYRIQTKDILFSWSGNPDTSIDTFIWANDPAWLNQHIFRVIPHAPNERAFILQTLRFLRPVFTELARNKQTTGLGHVTVADMKRLMVSKPTGAVLEIFNIKVGNIHERIFKNEQQILTLASLRDVFLPRLISGQLRVPNPQKALGSTHVN
jgi:type I restriction enzyme S subunit